MSYRVRILRLTALSLAATLALALAACSEQKSDDQATPTTTSSSSTSTTTTSTAVVAPASLNDALSAGKCTGAGRIPMARPIVPTADLEYIEPYGGLSGASTFPRFAQYWDFKGQTPVSPDQFAIMTPGDGTIVKVTKRNDGHEIIVEHTCDTYSIFSNVARLSGPLLPLDKVLTLNQVSEDRVAVTAGTAFGLDGEAPGFEYAFVDQVATSNVSLTTPTLTSQPWLSRLAPPLDYLSGDAATQVRQSLVGGLTPPDGVVPINATGSVAGMWGSTTPDTQLSLVASNLDPKASMVSFGSSTAAQHFVVSKWPNGFASFDQLTTTSGIVVIEMSTFTYVTQDGKPWIGDAQVKVDQLTAKPGDLYGYLLMQLVDRDTLRAELFASSESPRVGFTTDAVTYKR
jgi:hypothetical protein